MGCLEIYWKEGKPIKLDLFATLLTCVCGVWHAPINHQHYFEAISLGFWASLTWRLIFLYTIFISRFFLLAVLLPASWNHFDLATFRFVLPCSPHHLLLVVFDDGDIATLKRTQICLKGDKHYMESDTLDRLPLTNPEHFSTPVNLLKTQTRRRRAHHSSPRYGTGHKYYWWNVRWWHLGCSHGLLMQDLLECISCSLLCFKASVSYGEVWSFNAMGLL